MRHRRPATSSQLCTSSHFPQKSPPPPKILKLTLTPWSSFQVARGGSDQAHRWVFQGPALPQKTGPGFGDQAPGLRSPREGFWDPPSHPSHIRFFTWAQTHRFLTNTPPWGRIHTVNPHQRSPDFADYSPNEEQQNVTTIPSPFP